MHEKRIPADAHDDDDVPLRLDDDVADRCILGLLLNSEGPGLWLTEELALEVGDQLATVDSLTRLYAAGLIHRCQDTCSRLAPRSSSTRLRSCRRDGSDGP